MLPREDGGAQAPLGVGGNIFPHLPRIYVLGFWLFGLRQGWSEQPMVSANTKGLPLPFGFALVTDG